MYIIHHKYPIVIGDIIWEYFGFGALPCIMEEVQMTDCWETLPLEQIKIVLKREWLSDATGDWWFCLPSCAVSSPKHLLVKKHPAQKQHEPAIPVVPRSCRFWTQQIPGHNRLLLGNRDLLVVQPVAVRPHQVALEQRSATPIRRHPDTEPTEPMALTTGASWTVEFGCQSNVCHDQQM